MCITVSLKSSSLVVINVYNPQDSGVIPKPPDCLLNDNNILMCGDFNARHPLLGSRGGHNNANGRLYYDYITNTSDPVQLLCQPSPTHTMGRKLDYFAFYSSSYTHATSIIDEGIVSDHWAMRVTLPFCLRPAPPPRLRHHVTKKNQSKFVDLASTWYKSFTPNSLDHFYQTICSQAGTFAEQLQAHKPNPNLKRRSKTYIAHLIDKDPEVIELRELIRFTANKLKDGIKNPYDLQDLTYFSRELNKVISRKREEGLYAWAEKN